PAMLMAHGGFVLPSNVPANEFLNLEGDKISTSRNWAVWLHEYLNDFPGREDELRYVLTSIAPESKDSEFTWKDYQARVNNELVAILGNFVNRTLVLTEKYFNAKVPDCGKYTPEDLACLESITKAQQSIETALDNFRFRDALAALMDLARIGNKYLADQEPWKIFKTDASRVATVLHVSLKLTAAIATLSKPFLPRTADRIFSMLAMKEVSWKDLKAFQLPVQQRLNNIKLLYEKIEDAPIRKQIDKLHDSKIKQVQTPVINLPVKPDISFDDFQKLNIITATITEAERVPRTDKLMKLCVDTGSEKRTVVSGIAQCFEPHQIIGQKVLLLANLAPRKIKGIESRGMILMASDSEGKLFFATITGDAGNGNPVS
ncbi:MAG: class I tRNA ligase family protein, partial [Bacteroidia bacterium]|nr:class I tRNA ligase family protein [Bacteroidia bacterium]